MIKVQKSYGEILVDTAVAEGQARVELSTKLKNAKNMLVRDSADYIAGIVELPVEYILELESGTSIDKMMEKYFHYDN